MARFLEMDRSSLEEREKGLIKKCAYCGKDFEGQNAVFCSMACYSKKRPCSPERERFWSKVDIKGLFDCWEWKGRKDIGGYGFFTFRSKEQKAHRVVWILTYGEIPEGMQINHKCDNRGCVNPAHLYIGTQKDNVADMYSRGRQVVLAGSKSAVARLTEQEVLAIRVLFQTEITKADLARMFNISESSIRFIIQRKTWKHI
jgi:hypothetical protein